MAYVKARVSVDQLAAAMGPMGGFVPDPEEMGDGSIDQGMLNKKKLQYIAKCEQPKFVDDWNTEKPLTMIEAIAKSIQDRQERGENTEADLTKSGFVYTNRINYPEQKMKFAGAERSMGWTALEKAEMKSVEQDEELNTKGKFVKFG